VHVRLGLWAQTICGFWRDMSEEGGRDGPRRVKCKSEPELDDENAHGHLDTEGSGAHLVEVIAHNALKEIILKAKETVQTELGSFKLPSYVMDELLVRCEKVLLNYGEEEALSVMVFEIKAHLDRMRKFKERDNDRKVRERLPSSAGREDTGSEPTPSKAQSHRRE